MNDSAARHVRKRGLSSVAASASTALLLFFVFRLTASSAGIATIGVWSLLQGLFIATRVADSGVGVNVTKYVRLLVSEQRSISLPEVVISGLLIGTVPAAGLCAIAYFPILSFVESRYGPDLGSEQIVSMTIGAVAFAVLSSSATLTLAVCEGLGLLATKNFIIVISNAAGGAVAYPLITSFKGSGLVTSYASVALVQLFAALCIITKKRRMNATGEGVFRIVRSLWRENVQLISVATLRLSFEPVTKLCLSLTSGLEVLAAFELALRVTTQARVLVQSGAQPLLLLGVRRGKATSQLLSKFLKADTFLIQAALLFTGLLLTVTTLVSQLGLGYVDRNFVLYFGVLSIANAINTAGMTGYYLQLSSGDLRPLVRIHVSMAAVNILGGCVALLFDSSLAVVCSYSACLVLGGARLMRILGVSVDATVKSYACRLLRFPRSWCYFAVGFAFYGLPLVFNVTLGSMLFQALISALMSLLMIVEMLRLLRRVR